MDNLFSFIYPIVPLIGFAGYVPQIIRLLKIQRPAKSISFQTWMIWTLTWGISLGYGIFCLQDLLFSLTCFMNVVCHIIIMALTYFKRVKYAQNPLVLKAPLKTSLCKEALP